MKKYYITDEDGDSYEIEEVDAIENSEETPDNNVEDDETRDFSSEEIVLLKKLLKCAPNIFKMFEGKEEVSDEEEIDEEEKQEKEEKEEVEDCDGSSDEEIYDSDEIEEEEEVEEKVDDSCKKKMKTDSKKSFGSIEKRNKISDSTDEHELDIAAAWAKRYGGNK